MAQVLGTSGSASTVWLMPGAHRKRHMLIKHNQDYDLHTEYLVLVVFYKHVHVRCAPDSSHSNILKFKVVVAAVS